MAGKYDHVKQLIRAGKRAEARDELAAMVRADPQDADAWYGLAQVIDDPEKKRYCLQKAHELRPPAQPAAPPAMPNTAAETKTGAYYPSSQPRKSNYWRNLLLFAVAAPVLVCVCLTVFALIVYYPAIIPHTKKRPGDTPGRLRCLACVSGAQAIGLRALYTCSTNPRRGELNRKAPE